MPVKYQITEQSLENRKAILALCANSPKTLMELSIATGRTKEALRFNVGKLIESKNLKIKGTKLNEHGRECFAYLATNSKYTPDLDHKIPEAVKKSIIRKDEYESPSYVRIVSADDYHPTRGTPKRRDAWIGSTFSTMTF
jgi:predicted house-cleaning noncanonical NTP pyrophosphatase (MazG superfamily)